MGILSHTKPGRFISGIIVGALLMSALLAIALFVTYYCYHTAKTTPGADIFMPENGNILKLVFSVKVSIFLATTAAGFIIWGMFNEPRWNMRYVAGLLPLCAFFLLWAAFAKYKPQDYLDHSTGTEITAFWCIVYSYIPLTLAMGIKFAMGTRAMGQGKPLRGTKKVEGNPRQIEQQLYALSQQANKGLPPGVLVYEKDKRICMPWKKEIQGAAIIGSPGAGKTQIVYRMIEDVRRRGDKIIITDTKGTFVQALAGEPGVSILMARDKRSVAWCLGLDVLNSLDCHQAAYVLIPPHSIDSQPHFLNSARNVLAAVLIQLNAIGNKWGWHDLWETISKGKDDLRRFLQRTKEGRSAATSLEGDTKAAHDVYSTLMTALHPTIFLAEAWGNSGISLKEWASDPKSQILIIGGMAEDEELNKLTMRLSLQIIVNGKISLSEDLNRRIWHVIDEMAAIGYHKTLVEAFTTGRSRGLCVIAGLQDVGHIEHLYGHELTKSMFNVFSTFMFMRCVDSVTAEWVAKTIGDQETADFTGETDSGLLNKSKNTTVRHKPVFMASEISNFDDMTGVLKVAGWPVAQLTWPVKPIPQTYPRLTEADWVNKKTKLDDLPDDKKKGNDAPPNKDKPDKPNDQEDSPWEN